MDDGRRNGSATLASVTLPPLRKGTVVPSTVTVTGVSPPQLPSRPGTAVRLRPPTPPPRPEATLPLSSPPPSSSAVSRLDGGGGSLFSSQAAGRLLPASPSSSLLPSSLPEQPITLTNPRTLRQQNVYVDTPIKAAPLALNTAKQRPRTLLTKQSSNQTTVINHQPVPTCKKPPVILPVSPTDSIICGDCGRCRCEACRSPRPLPSSWLCDNGCLCSLESVVDTLSCMCCVKGGLYHCGEGLTRDPDTRDETWIDKPCSCAPNKWWLRWSCLLCLSVPLPCLLCYPVLKGAAAATEKCYQAATAQGCRCPPSSRAPSSPLSTTTSPTDSQKRLLS